MKRITILVEDNVTLSDLSALISVAKDVRIETIPTEVKNKKRHVAGVSTESAIMSHFAPSGKFTTASASAWMEKAGFHPQSGSAACSKLVENGYLSRLGKGHFQFAKPYPSSSTAT